MNRIIANGIKVTSMLLFLTVSFLSCKSNLEEGETQTVTSITRGTNHQLTVGYFNGIDRIGPEYDLTKVPDRFDIVNIFNQFKPLWELSRQPVHALGATQPTLPEVLAGVKNLKEKGVKVVQTQFLREFMDNFKDSDHKINWTNTAADYDGFAKALRDTLDKWGFDGVDFDVEHEPQCLSKIGYDWQKPNYDRSTWLSTEEQMGYLNAMAKYFGPNATLPAGKPKKLLILDTNLSFSSLGYSKDLLAKFDYIYIQSYYGGFDTAFSYTDQNKGPGIAKEKIMLIPADFEVNPKSSNLKNAYMDPVNGRLVGGFGAYGFNFDQPDYPVFREMIKTLNPTGE